MVLGYLSTSIPQTLGVCEGMQQEWIRGEISSYDMVDEFLHRLIPGDEEDLTLLLPRIHVLSTNLDTGLGLEVDQPQNRTQLVTALKRTTWIPFLTGEGWLRDGTSRARYLDGYFSVLLHPPCRYSARVPFSWSSYMHSLNPGLSAEKALEFVEQGLAQTNPFWSIPNTTITADL